MNPLGLPPMPAGYRLGTLSNVQDRRNYRAMLIHALRDADGLLPEFRDHNLARVLNADQPLPLDSDSRIIFLVDTHSQRPKGMVQLTSHYEPPFDKLVSVDYLSVLPKYRKQRIGTELLNVAENRAAQTNHAVSVLSAVAGKVPWYEDRGYAQADLAVLRELMPPRQAYGLIDGINRGLIPMVKRVTQCLDLVG